MRETLFDTQTFRSALDTFASAVTIITAKTEDGGCLGLRTKNFSCVSLEPPLILWSLPKSSDNAHYFQSTKSWNVHVLSTEQTSLSAQFAEKETNNLTGLEFDEGISGIPLLQDCAARFQCRTAFIYNNGDHLIIVGEVLAVDKSEHLPLIHHYESDGWTALALEEPPTLSSGETTLESGYTEDLLGYLLGRAHFQLIHPLQPKFKAHGLNGLDFFVLSVLCIKDYQTLDQINSYIDYTGQTVTLESMQHLIDKDLVALNHNDNSYQLTGEGRELSVFNIAEAKAIEEKLVDELGQSAINVLKILLKKLVVKTDPGLPDLWAAD